jgi:MFS family permease
MSDPSPHAAGGFPKAETLANRTFIGLLIAQFLAAFNDQAIHASAMFFAINTKSMTESTAISLMPILFFAPWAIFPTLAGYYADKYSKRTTLVFWKFAEIGITGLALVGFIIGSELNMPNIGAIIVLSTVFLMGLHSTFFVPAKYGAMPEVLSDDLLSRGNGFLESLSFLATILGTVCGGLLSYYFQTDEYVIGILLMVLAMIGAGASLMIRRMPAANPGRAFPRYVYKPLFENLREIIRSRPLRFALVGIAFFTFMVAFMRAAVYMLGESRAERWNELQTSGIVGMTALGIGLGSPLAGWLSGKKVELGLLPIGGICMVIAICVAAMFMDNTRTLIICIILIGFFTGFYLVPLFTQQQHRAPKKEKGQVVATFNFTNVIGAMIASVLFFALVNTAHYSGISPRLDQQDDQGPQTLTVFEVDKHHRPRFIQFVSEVGVGRNVGNPAGAIVPPIWDLEGDEDNAKQVIHLSQKALVAWDKFEEKLNDSKSGQGAPPPQEGISVRVSQYWLAGNPHFYVRSSDEPLPTVYDNRQLPRYLFLGAAVMTLLVLAGLFRLLPDLLQRTRWVLQSLGKARLRVHGILNLPGSGAVVIVTNAAGAAERKNVAWASDRQVHFLNGYSEAQIKQYVARGDVVAVSVTANDQSAFEKLRGHLGSDYVVLPIHCGKSEIKFGAAISATSGADEVLEAIAKASESQEH